MAYDLQVIFSNAFLIKLPPVFFKVSLKLNEFNSQDVNIGSGKWLGEEHATNHYPK